jgi:hypothetical protein
VSTIKRGSSPKVHPASSRRNRQSSRHGRTLGNSYLPTLARVVPDGGATEDEATAHLPGDDLLDNPDIVSTRAIGIDAPPGSIGPWLAQIGSGRGGLYTYDWIENLLGLHMHSIDVVLPQFPTWVMPNSSERAGRRCEWLCANPARRWCSVRTTATGSGRSCSSSPLRRLPGSSSRNRTRTLGASCATRPLYRYLMEPGSLVMLRKMLLGVKQRAEDLVHGNVVPTTSTIPTIRLMTESTEAVRR